jgi:hypothetical protein
MKMNSRRIGRDGLQNKHSAQHVGNRHLIVGYFSAHYLNFEMIFTGVWRNSYLGCFCNYWHSYWF